MGRTLLLMAATMGLPEMPQAAEPALSFAAVVHPSNATRDIRVRDLTSLFGGVNRQWSNNSPVVLVERDSSSAPYRYLMAHLLNITAGEYKRRLQNIEYRGDAPVSI